MRLLFDTHAFLWWCAAEAKLSTTVVAAVGDAANQVFVSAVSSWEIATKSRLGGLPLPEPPSDFIPRMIERRPRRSGRAHSR